MQKRGGIVDNKTEDLPIGFFSDVDPDKLFWLQNGQSVKNLSDLVNILKDLDRETFNAHVNLQKNDFANWIRDVIDEELGEQLLEIKDKDRIITIIEKKFENLSKKQEKPSLKFPTLKKIQIKEEPIEVPKPISFDSRLNEILKKEKEIEAREKIIQNIEERIERKLQATKEKRFFSKEFIEGLLIGILILLICGLVYLKFFMPY